MIDNNDANLFRYMDRGIAKWVEKSGPVPAIPEGKVPDFIDAIADKSPSSFKGVFSLDTAAPWERPTHFHVFATRKAALEDKVGADEPVGEGDSHAKIEWALGKLEAGTPRRLGFAYGLSKLPHDAVNELKIPTK